MTHIHDEHGSGLSPDSIIHGDMAQRILTIRMYSGLSGDMFLAGLLRLTGLEAHALNECLAAIMPELAGSVQLLRKEVGHVGGWHVQVHLPQQHEHRSLGDITDFIQRGGLSAEGKRLSLAAFTLLAQAEGAVHGLAPQDVHFHEVGALDSILDTCLTCELYSRLAPLRLVVSPVPLADGSIACAHGCIPLPAPAVLQLLEGVPVCSFLGEGETITPTAMALLHALGAEFGPWPSMRLERQALVYGDTVFPGAPNGALFALGTATE
ncbi:MAG: LarC family nickel insertion protein [Desulfovibrio sp.]|nr:LarC family nickel insertion protein [Desulfovibrio sp.]